MPSPTSITPGRTIGVPAVEHSHLSGNPVVISPPEVVHQSSISAGDDSILPATNQLAAQFGNTSENDYAAAARIHEQYNHEPLSLEDLFPGFDLTWHALHTDATPDILTFPQTVEDCYTDGRGIEQATAPTGFTRPSASDQMANTMEQILNQIPHPEGDIAQSRSHAYYLWDMFTRQIVPLLTGFGSHSDNPFLKYLIPEAERNAAILTAVLYFTHRIEMRQREQQPGESSGCFIEEETNHILQRLEHDSDQRSGDIAPCHTVKSGELTMLVVLCMAFVVSQDSAKLIYYMEYATIICQELFKTFAGEEDFLYLAKMLGFLHNSLLFSSLANCVNAPDYLGVALEVPVCDRSTLANTTGSHSDDPPLKFSDLDIFSGMSTSIATTMYTLGNLIKRKQSGVDCESPTDAGTFVRAFESDVDGLEARLRRRGTILKKTTVSSPSSSKRSLAQHLDMYNIAVFWSAYALFLTDLKNLQSTNPEVRDAVQLCLEACAEVPRTSQVAPLLTFPLAVGGMRATNKVYREFVLNRLSELKNVGLTDTRRLCGDLERWWEDGQTTSGPLSFTALLVL